LYFVGNIEVKTLFVVVFIFLLLFEGNSREKPDRNIFKNNRAKGITKELKGKLS
jgi:uncharacterized membrane protein